MDNGENTTKKKTFKLTKVNSRDGDNVVYDAYGYEIKPESENGDRPLPEPEPQPAVRHDTGDRPRTERRTYDPDIRAAIESGAHRQTRYTEDNYTGDRPRSERSETVRENAARAAAAGTHQARVSEEQQAARRAEQGERTARTDRTAQKTEKAQKNKKTKKSKKAQKTEKARKKREAAKARELEQEAAQTAQTAQEAQDRTAPETESEEQPKKKLTAAELRARYVKMQRRETWLGVLKVLAVVLVLALIIVLITVNSRKDKQIDTQYLSVGYIDDAADGTLSFLRAENPVYSHVSGVFVPNVNEGDRVAKNAVIGHVIKEEYS
ncbi:MAG: hypothetical protein J6V14_07285, partial [Clostridia bacterium]|nr:hypothetical protein [Clostridia bacterium]